MATVSGAAIELLVKLKDEATRQLDGITKAVDKSAGRMRALGLAVMGVGTAALGGLVALTAKSMAAADEIKGLAEAANMSIDPFQRLAFVVTQNEGDVNTLVRTMNRLTAVTSDAVGGNKKYQEAFVALGIPFKNLDGSMRSNMSVLLDMADAYATGRLKGEQMGAMLDMLGIRGGVKLYGTLKLGRQGILDMMAAAKGVIPADTIAKMDEFQDKWNVMNLSIRKLIMEAITPLLPSFNKLVNLIENITERFSKLMPGTRAFIGQSVIMGSGAMIAGGGMMFLVGALKSTKIIIDTFKFSSIITGLTNFGNACLALNPMLMTTMASLAGLVAVWSAAGSIAGLFSTTQARRELDQWNKYQGEVMVRWEGRRKTTGKGFFTPTETEWLKKYSVAAAELAKTIGTIREPGMPKWSLENVLGKAKGELQAFFSGFTLPTLKLPEAPALKDLDIGLAPGVEDEVKKLKEGVRDNLGFGLREIIGSYEWLPEAMITQSRFLSPAFAGVTAQAGTKVVNLQLNVKSRDELYDVIDRELDREGV